MKKLLATLTLLPLTISACGGSTASTPELPTVEAITKVKGVYAGGYDGVMNKIVSGDIHFGGAWADTRFYAEEGAADIVAVGVEKTRIANDGIQVKRTMNPYDMFALQKLFVKMVEDSSNPALQIDKWGNQESLFNAYNTSAYTKITNTSDKVSYLNDGIPTEVSMLQTAPSETAGSGELFQTLGTTGHYTDYRLKAGKELKITFIPSNDRDLMDRASRKLEEFLDANNMPATVNVASDYDTAATALANGTTDMAFLSVTSWAKRAPTTNFILQSGRPTQIATLEWDGTNVSVNTSKITNQKHTVRIMNEFSQTYLKHVTTANLNANNAAPDSSKNANLTKFQAMIDDSTHELHTWARKVRELADSGENTIAGSYESFIYAKKGGVLHNAIKPIYEAATYNPDWTVSLPSIKKYGYTSLKSGASFIYPQLWINKHLNATIEVEELI